MRCADCRKEFYKEIHFMIHDCKPKEEAKMTNVNKHGVNYSEIEKGDLVKLALGDNTTVLGYVTEVNNLRLYAIWSDDFEEVPERFSLGKILGHWKVVVHEPKSSEDNLSVAQEAANFGYQAVQGIINAYKEKNAREVLSSETVELLAKEIAKATELPLEDYYRGFDDGVEHAKNDGIVFNFKDFDSSVRRTWKQQDFKDAVTNAALGLTGEAGEVADLIKKAEYHGRGWKSWSNQGDTKAISKEDVLDELSDVLFYVSGMAQEFGFTLEDVAKHNKAKLEKRFPEGFSTEASAQKVDKAPEVKPEGEILIGYSVSFNEDTLEYVKVDKAPFGKTYFSTDYELKKTLKELRDGNRVTIEDRHKGEFKFTKVGNLMRVHFKDLEGNLDSHTCLVKVSYEEVTD